MPKVSVITPMYNAERFIGATIESVRAQTLQDWEHIVVDDGSTDGSTEVVKRYLPLEPRLKLVQQPNGGVSKARNRGFCESSPESEYIVFFDADDIMEPEMLATLSAHLDQYPEVGMVFCRLRRIDAEGQPLEDTQNTVVKRYQPTRFWVRPLAETELHTPFCSFFCLNIILPSTTMLRRAVFQQTPGFDETFGHVFEDADLFFQMALRAPVHYLPIRVVRYRSHEDQSTSIKYLDRYGHQEQKLLHKWRSMEGLSPEQERMVKEAFWFRETRLLPYQGFQAGWRHLKKGQVLHTARFWGGAMKRYVKGLMTRPR
ncbi:glycosyl transferase [Chthonomonas calidirosea]|uniref:glycosyltransferase family 2 protein n=1 Tax=Chthonomonas calidirosea TaxID=454171 RepID=UPI0006DD3E58|nr:glycosyltransferase [Chthonomonas calidirosea]CEK16913.1 glycosyl transferase [Chthonomonas calidirosea]